MDILQTNIRNLYKTGWMTGDGLELISMEPDIRLPSLNPREKQDRHVAFRNESGRRSRSRKKRPRSSPVNSRREIRLRWQSPSVSPVQALRSAASRSAIAKHFNDDFTNKRIYALGNGVESFFSPRPPIEPMRIVFFHPTQKSNQLSNKTQIPVQIGDTSEISPPVYLADLTMPVQPVPPSARFASSHSTSRVPSRVPSEQKQRYIMMNETMVRCLLVELVSKLPLRILVADAATTAISSPGLPQREPKHVRRRRGKSCCSIAVQAAAAACVKTTSEVSYATEQATDAKGEEWVGGVRALRDSHVRLVLHQLRHIDRLNRALDRTFRPPRPQSRSCKRPLHLYAS